MTPLETRLTAQVQMLAEHHRQLCQENKLLRENIDLLVRRIFGAKSEQLDESQLMLLLQGSDEGAKKAPVSGADPAVLEAEIAKAPASYCRRRTPPPRVPSAGASARRGGSH